MHEGARACAREARACCPIWRSVREAERSSRSLARLAPLVGADLSRRGFTPLEHLHRLPVPRNRPSPETVSALCSSESIVPGAARDREPAPPFGGRNEEATSGADGLVTRPTSDRLGARAGYRCQAPSSRYPSMSHATGLLEPFAPAEAHSATGRDSRKRLLSDHAGALLTAARIDTDLPLPLSGSGRASRRSFNPRCSSGSRLSSQDLFHAENDSLAGSRITRRTAVCRLR